MGEVDCDRVRPDLAQSTSPAMLPHKNSKVDDRRLHLLYTEIGLIAALLVVAAAFRVPLNPKPAAELIIPEAEAIMVEEIERTIQMAPPPPPTALPPPIEVADTKVIEEMILPSMELDMEVAFSPPPAPPPPPPTPQEVAPPPPPPPPPPEPEVFVVVEQMPELIGGLASISVEYPELDRLAGIEGRVFLQFIVNEDGTVSDVVVLRGVSVGIDQAAIEAVRRARFTPGMQRGRPVRVRFSIPITFRLSDGA